MNLCVEIPCQQGSLEWHAARAGCLTASIFHTLITGSVKAKNSLIDKLERELIGIHPNPDSEAMRWGREHEATARGHYRAFVAHVEECGFFTHSQVPLVGCSPDGIRRSPSGSVLSGVEIKCPYTQNVHRSHLSGAISPQYYWQCQFSIWVTGAGYWDFMSFDPRETGADRAYTCRYVRDDLIMFRIAEAVEEFSRLRETFCRYKDIDSAAVHLAAGEVPDFFKGSK